LKILFVTWDGPQVTYLESLFVPIFAGLRERGIQVDVLQFRWGTAEQAREVGALCADSGCGYRHADIRRGLGGLGPFLTALAGGPLVRRAAAAFGSDLIMPRSHMAALATAAAGGAGFRPIVFDADGFAADERVEFASLSPNGPTYRLLRYIEARTARAAESVIVRSSQAAAILSERAGRIVAPDRFHVVTNGRDENVFRPLDEAARAQVRRELGLAPASPLVVYAGSVGPQYRFDLVRGFAGALAQRRADARLLVLTGSPDLARKELGDSCALAPLVMSVEADRVAPYLAAADLGLAFRARTFSTAGLAPLKLAEYLLCGLPVLGNGAIGRCESAIAAGIFFDDSAGPEAAARWFDEDVMPNRERLRGTARAIGVDNFALSNSVEDYLDALGPLRGRFP
jgi:glycosyltransferase involved in cell wall biosynthesis